VLAIDCRDFYDPQRHKEKARGGHFGRDNHIGLHHTVFSGLLRGGAQVYDRRARKKEDMPLQDWWQRFVLSPLRKKIQLFREHLKAWESRHSGVESSCRARLERPRLAVVFFCKWGRHRSVALQSAFLSICQRLKWVRVSESSHLSELSWRFSTCNCCQALDAFAGDVTDVTEAVGSATDS
jgi:hypothetical protein